MLPDGTVLNRKSVPSMVLKYLSGTMLVQYIDDALGLV